MHLQNRSAVRSQRSPVPTVARRGPLQHSVVRCIPQSRHYKSTNLSSRPAIRHRTVCSAAASSSSSPTTSDSRSRRSIWTAIDVAALLGAVGGALAALLGVVSPTYALVLPLVLPVVSLVAALQREDLTKEVRRKTGSVLLLYFILFDSKMMASST